jgi:hypothetical protein
MRALTIAACRLCSVLLFAFVVVAARPTEAAVFDYSLTIVPEPGLSGSGTIGFNDLTGSGPADPDFSDFSFTLTNLGGTSGLPFTFTKSMVTAVDWIIDPITFALQLDLDVATQIAGANDYDISFDNLPPLSASSSCSFISITSTDTVNACKTVDGAAAANGGNFTATRTAAAPEPGTLALLAAVLFGFVLVRYERHSRTTRSFWRLARAQVRADRFKRD